MQRLTCFRGSENGSFCYYEQADINTELGTPGLATKTYAVLALYFSIPGSPLKTIVKPQSSAPPVKAPGSVFLPEKSINFCFWRWNDFMVDVDAVGAQR